MATTIWRTPEGMAAAEPLAAGFAEAALLAAGLSALEAGALAFAAGLLTLAGGALAGPAAGTTDEAGALACPEQAASVRQHPMSIALALRGPSVLSTEQAYTNRWALPR